MYLSPPHMSVGGSHFSHPSQRSERFNLGSLTFMIAGHYITDNLIEKTGLSSTVQPSCQFFHDSIQKIATVPSLIG